jgi:membrane protease YdiL (CAAX protease family)
VRRDPPESGPPGSGVFSIEGREAPGLYFAGWLLSVGGVLLIAIATLAASDVARLLLGLGGAAVLGLGLSAAAGYQIVVRSERDRTRYRGPAPLLVFGVVVSLSTVASAFLLGTGILDPTSPFGFLVGLLIVAVAYALTVWLFAVRSGALTWRSMGWPTLGPGRLLRALRDVGVAIAVMIPVTFVVLVVGGIVAALLGVEAPDVLPAPTTSAEALAVALAAAVVAPIGEELFFRGFALTAWLRDLGPGQAVFRSAVFFAIVHVANISAVTFREGAAQALLQVAVILPLGVVLGVLFLRRGIVAAIAGHVAYNGLLLALLALRAYLPEPA